MITSKDFKAGTQPCQQYTPQKDYYGFPNIHDCYGPFDGRPRGCTGKVSFCLNCYCDHHSGGKETCGVEVPK